MYVFDNSPLSVLFKNYYRGRFPSLWKNFDELVASGGIISTREVVREIEDSAITELRDWAKNNSQVFTVPTAAEANIGPLAVYDIAHRIAAYRRLSPKLVYLHRGTLTGARLLGFSGKLLDPRRLPKAFSRLKPYEIEDCLCIYKNALAMGKLARNFERRRPVCIDIPTHPPHRC